MYSNGDHKSFLFFLIRITRGASLTFYKYRAPLSCPKRDARQDHLWGKAFFPPLRKAAVGFPQKPRNIMERKKSKP